MMSDAPREIHRSWQSESDRQDPAAKADLERPNKPVLLARREEATIESIDRWVWIAIHWIRQREPSPRIEQDAEKVDHVRQIELAVIVGVSGILAINRLLEDRREEHSEKVNGIGDVDGTIGVRVPPPKLIPGTLTRPKDDLATSDWRPGTADIA